MPRSSATLGTHARTHSQARTLMGTHMGVARRASAAQSVVSGEGLRRCYFGEKASFVIAAADVDGMPLDASELNVVSVGLSQEGYSEDVSTVNVTTTADGEAGYSVVYVVAKQDSYPAPQQYYMTVLVNGSAVGGRSAVCDGMYGGIVCRRV